MERKGSDGLVGLLSTTHSIDGANRVTEGCAPAPRRSSHATESLRIGLLTGGGDKPYVVGLATTLASRGVVVDLIGSDALECPQLLDEPRVNFLNLRGNLSPKVGFARKMVRILAFYGRLIRYAATAKAKVFHILWNNRFEFFDRTVLMLYYRALGKRIVMTVHNVNAGQRDADDTRLNRASLWFQYKLTDHFFVHTAQMKNQLAHDFAVSSDAISVIPLGINNSVRNSDLTSAEARQRMGLGPDDRALLFYGRIVPYKGLVYAIAALAEVLKTNRNCRLIIAGGIQDCPDYWRQVQDDISRRGVRDRTIERIEFIPDDDTELYFKAADALVLPYTDIFQSGVLVLAYNFGLPVIAADVGSLREDIVEDETGYLFRPKDPEDMARAIRKYFDSDLYRELEQRRQDIKDYANQRYSWATVGEITCEVYARLSKQ